MISNRKKSFQVPTENINLNVLPRISRWSSFTRVNSIFTTLSIGMVNASRLIIRMKRSSINRVTRTYIASRWMKLGNSLKRVIQARTWTRLWKISKRKTHKLPQIKHKWSEFAMKQLKISPTWESVHQFYSTTRFWSAGIRARSFSSKEILSTTKSFLMTKNSTSTNGKSTTFSP